MLHRDDDPVKHRRGARRENEHHSVVRTDADGPCLVESFTVTPANGDPADAVMPLLRRLHDRRSTDDNVLAAVDEGRAAILADVVADPGYTNATIDRWHLPIKALGANPIGRMHRTNQDGPRLHKVGRGARAGTVLTFGGRPVCRCILHTALADLRHPTFPCTRAVLDAYQAQAALVARFEWEPNGAPRAGGSRSWLAPHRASGPLLHRSVPPPARRRDRPRRRRPPRLADWYRRWNPRNRVEGSFGILKSLAVIYYGRDYHHFVGLARETLVAAFAIVAYNAHMLAQWEARTALAESDDDSDDDPFGGLPSAQPAETAPGATAARAAARCPTPARGPKGLEHLGARPPPG